MTTTTDEIVDYVMESPHNTNPAVLRSLLSEHSEDSSEVMERIQELEETKQDKLTPGNGIEIDENNVIDNTILSIFNTQAVITALRNKISVSISNEVVPNSTALRLKITAKITATGEELKTALLKYNGLRFSYTVNINGLDVSPLLPSQEYEFYYKLDEVECEFAHVQDYGLHHNRYCYGDAQSKTFAPLGDILKIYGYKNYVKSLDSEASYELTINLLYYVIMDGKVIKQNDAYDFLVDPTKYSWSGQIIPLGLN